MSDFWVGVIIGAVPPLGVIVGMLLVSWKQEKGGHE